MQIKGNKNCLEVGRTFYGLCIVCEEMIRNGWQKMHTLLISATLLSHLSRFSSPTKITILETLATPKYSPPSKTKSDIVQATGLVRLLLLLLFVEGTPLPFCKVNTSSSWPWTALNVSFKKKMHTLYLARYSNSSIYLTALTGNDDDGDDEHLQ